MLSDDLEHGLAAIGSSQPTLLILGSMPSVASLQSQAYYAHPRNAFWRIIETAYAAPASDNYEQRCALLAANNIMVWDVIKAAKRKGSLDSAIETATISINNFDFLCAPHCKVGRVLCNGGKAFSLFNKHVIAQHRLAQQVLQLPSTSPANAATAFEQKLAIWQQALTLPA